MTGGVSPFLPCSDAVSREALETQLHSQGFEPSQLPLRWLTLTEVTQKPQLLEQVIVETVEPASRCRRSHQPLASLCLALQCGGSDAFSGVTANPLQASLAQYVISRGGSAVLAETGKRFIRLV